MGVWCQFNNVCLPSVSISGKVWYFCETKNAKTSEMAYRQHALLHCVRMLLQSCETLCYGYNAMALRYMISYSLLELQILEAAWQYRLFVSSLL